MLRFHCLCVARNVLLVAAIGVCGPSAVQALEKKTVNCPEAMREFGSALPDAFEKMKGISLVPDFEGEPAALRRAFVDVATVTQTQAALRRLPAVEQAKAGFEAYLEMRLKNYPAWVKRKIYSEVRQAQVQDGAVLSRATETGKPGISLIVPAELTNSISHYKLLAREIEYAIQEAEVAMGLLKKSDRQQAEFGAMRAEWDFKRIFRADSLKRDADRVQASRLPPEVKTNETRELNRPAETFEQFRTNRLRPIEDPTPKTQIAELVVVAPIPTTTIAPGYSSRHSAAIDRLIALRVLSKEDGNHVLSSGDPQKIWSTMASDKISDDERGKLRALFAGDGDTVRGETIKSPPKTAPVEAAEAVVPVKKDSAELGIELLLDNPDALRRGAVIEFPSNKNNPVRMRFTNRSLEQTSKAERPIIQKFVNAIRSGMAAETLDPTKIRVLSSAHVGSKGRPFEVVIIQRGHPRLFGCVKDGVYTVMTYDPHAPETIAGFNLRYSNLCN